MFAVPVNSLSNRTTAHGIVLPFYLYGGFSFVLSCVFLWLSVSDFAGHYFTPSLLAITHTMALGWGTMVIFGAAHQLVPVLIEGRLYSITLGYVTFALAALGIPMLVWGFYIFDMALLAPIGSVLIILSVFAFMINMGKSMVQSQTENVHAVFIFSSAVWLMITIVLGFLLVLNFRYRVFRLDSLQYLPLHAHAGLAGWFLMLITGVAARLIPMFLISKYSRPVILWSIYWLMNVALVLFVFLYLYTPSYYLIIPSVLMFVAVLLFAYYIYRAYQNRIRKKVENPMALSLFSIVALIIPSGLALLFTFLFFAGVQLSNPVILLYGFILFFGWISSLIMGMTFKTLPFIVWNRLYQLHNKDSQKVPNPKDMFHPLLFKIMLISYLLGAMLFAIGIVWQLQELMYAGSAGLLVASVSYLLHLFFIITLKKSNRYANR